MTKKINVLVFPAGEVNAIELHTALSTCVNVQVFGASSVERHGSYVFKNYFKDLPRINEDHFLEVFNKLLKDNNIDVIFPTHDAVSDYFANNLDKVHAKIVVSDAKTAALCRDKKLFYDQFKNESWIPQFFERLEDVTLPAFLKPGVGGGSVGAKKVSDKNEIKNIDLSEYVISEYLPGEEYTVDCLTDKDGRLRVVSPRTRDRTLAGISVAGQTKKVEAEVKKIAETLNAQLSFKGLWFFQIKRSANDELKVMEVSTRCAGGMALTRVLGANLPLLSVYVAMGMDIEPILNTTQIEMDRTLISRYHFDYEYDTVYIDFDDTIIVNGAVNSYAIMFLYQCHAAGKKVYVLTRHAEDIYQTLEKYAISPKLFTDIISLSDKEHKPEHIKPSKAIFIDNAFAERKLVHDIHKIPVFDVDAFEVLLDWRV